MKKKKLSILLSLIITFSLSSNVFAANTPIPKILGKAAITIDMKTLEIIYDKDIDKNHMYPASTTKLMTALLLAENKKKGDLITYTVSGKTQPEYSLNINMHSMTVGETMSAEDAMDSLLLFSANDMAYVIADNVAGDSQKFSDKMNEKIAKLNLKNTHFVTPNGVDNNVNDHYTTPYDLAKIGEAAYNNEWVRQTMAKKDSKISTSTGTVLILENRNKLLGVDGCIGGKTGYTDKAGRCLVAFFDRDGRKIMGVVMNSIYDSKDVTVFEDMKKIIDWSYTAQKTAIHKSSDTIKTVPVTFKSYKFFGSTKTIELPILVKEDITIYNNDVNKKEIKEEYNIPSINPWKLDKEQSIGTVTIKERDHSTTYKLYSSKSSNEITKNVLPILITAGLAIILLILLIIIVIIRLINGKKRSKKRYN